MKTFGKCVALATAVCFMMVSSAAFANEATCSVAKATGLSDGREIVECKDGNVAVCTPSEVRDLNNGNFRVTCEEGNTFAMPSSMGKKINARVAKAGLRKKPDHAASSMPELSCPPGKTCVFQENHKLPGSVDDDYTALWVALGMMGSFMVILGIYEGTRPRHTTSW